MSGTADRPRLIEFAGKLPLTQQRFVSGVSARLLGLVALTPFPIAFGVAFVFGFQAGANHKGN